MHILRQSDFIVRSFSTDEYAEAKNEQNKDYPCRENRRDFADFQKNRRKLVVNRIWY